MPFITWQLPIFEKITGIDWVWHVVEGPALNVGCTSWCKKLKRGSSRDGTCEYLHHISRHDRVDVIQQPIWKGKVEMVNAPLSGVKEGDIVVQIDADEVWTARQLETICYVLDNNSPRNAAQFYCRYFVGPQLVITSRDGYGNHGAYEWRRAWRAQPGFAFNKHEPPETNRTDMWIGRDETETLGLVFDHYAYYFQESVMFKEKYYGYADAVKQWKALQSYNSFPVKAGHLLKWIKDDVEIDKLTIRPQ
jgi:hypothetical protein